MLISEIITEVIKEIGGDTSDTGLEAIFLTIAKGTLRRFPTHTRARLLEGTSTKTLSSGLNYITPLPTDFIREKEIYYLDNGSKKIIYKNDDFNLIVNTSSSGNPTYYRIIGNKIEFDKNADGDITIYFEYFKSVDNIVASDTFPFSSDFIEILKDGMKYTYFADYTEERDRAADKIQLFKAGLDKIESQYMIDTQGSHVQET